MSNTLFYKNTNSIQSHFLIYLYFIILGIDVLIDLLFLKSRSYILNPLLPLLLTFIYFKKSNVKCMLFIVMTIASTLADFLYGSNNLTFKWMGIISFFITELIIIICIVKLSQLKNFIPVIIVFFPFMYLLLFVFSITNQISVEDYFVLLFQNLIVSFIIALCFSNYFMSEHKNKWLFLFGILGVLIYFMCFVGKFYLPNLLPLPSNPLLTIVVAFTYYVFYKLVIIKESQIPL